jgi:dihydropteroate synthase
MNASCPVTSPWVGRPAFRLTLPSGRTIELGPRPLVMGILNVTPDSFSDGGLFFDEGTAVDHARLMAEEGADILDVGGESTRPGSDPVPAEEEMRRVVPVIRRLRGECGVSVSVDTQKAAVAEAALDAGAEVINDVSALRTDPDMPRLAAERRTPVVLMHMQGTPKTMQHEPTYGEVVREVGEWLERRLHGALASGLEPEQIIVDPGIGFGKTLQHNLEILRRLGELHRLGRPVLVGPSRKSMIGMVLDAPADHRLHGTLAAVAAAVLAGCHIVRVHDVAPAREVVAVCEAIRRGESYERA